MIFTPLEEAQQKIVTFGLLAQLVEQVTLNHFVGGSNPSQSTIVYFPIAQLVERLTVNQNVRGSSPRRGAILSPIVVAIHYCDEVGTSWGHSSVGRAVALQASGLRFDPACLHHLLNAEVVTVLIDKHLADTVGRDK